MITIGEIDFGNRLRAAQAFCDVLASNFKMHAAAEGSFRFMDREERTYLGKDIREFTRLDAAGRFDRIAMHRIA